MNTHPKTQSLILPNLEENAESAPILAEESIEKCLVSKREGAASQILSQKDPIICDTLPTKESLLILCASVQSADTPLCHKAAHYRYRQLTLLLKQDGHDMEVFAEMERISTLKGFWPKQST